MKLVFITFLMIFSADLYAVSKSSYPTTLVKSENNGATPWSADTWSHTQEVVEGPCLEVGRVLFELTCFNTAKSHNFPYYQMTKKNHFKQYRDAIWDYVSVDYLACYICQ